MDYSPDLWGWVCITLYCIVLYCTVLYWETKNIPVFDFYLIKHVFLSVGSLLVLHITACASPYTTRCNTMFDDTLNQFLSFILCVLYYCLSARFIVLTFLNGYEDRSEHFFSKHVVNHIVILFFMCNFFKELPFYQFKFILIGILENVLYWHKMSNPGNNKNAHLVLTLVHGSEIR